MTENPEALLTVRLGANATGFTGAPITTNIQENLFIGGFSFSWEDYLTFSADEVKTFVFDGTACSCAQITFEPLTFSADSGPITIDFYAGVTANSDGTLLGASNRRATSSNVTDAEFRLNPTGVSLGTRFAGDFVPSTGTGVGNTSGSASNPALPFEIDKDLKYAFVVTNKNGADTTVQIKSTWFEIPAGF